MPNIGNRIFGTKIAGSRLFVGGMVLLLMTVVWLAAWSKGYNVVGEGRMRGCGDCEFSNAVRRGETAHHG